jgi:hypothetical protein
MAEENIHHKNVIMKKLAGVTMIRQGCALDYCFEASINSMKAFCDVVYVCYVESEDETLELLKSIGGITIILCTKESWDKREGREKLSYFQNIAINKAQIDGYEYCFLCQADECVSQDSIPHIRQAVELGEEGYCVTRHNLWADEHHMLNVRQDRSPVSTIVNRLTKTYYRSYDDGESILSNSNLNFINKIEIFHMGFIRDNKKHIAKIKEIQQNIFQIEYDKRADLKEEFDWKDWGFTESDLVPIHKPLPIYLKDWILKLNK